MSCLSELSAETFVRKSEEAIAAREEHVEAFIEFSAALPEDLTRLWTTLCQRWESDRSQENPFLNRQNSEYSSRHLCCLPVR